MSPRIPGLLLAAAVVLAACSDSPAGPEGPTGQPARPDSVHVLAPYAEVVLGRTVQLAAQVRDRSGALLPDQRVAWRSSDTARATVSPEGLVTGRARGDVTITATAEGVSGRIELGVVLPVATAFLAPGLGPAIPVGTTQQFEVVAYDSAGRLVPDPRVRYRTSDPAVATVSASGVYQAVAPGSVRIEAQVENRLVTYLQRVVPGYRVTVLGTLGGAESRAFGASERGDVVGEAQTAAGEWHAFLWRDGRMVDVHGPGRRSRATAVNEAGEVAGVYWPTADTTGPTRPFVWRNGAATPLAPDARADHVYATDVNAQGHVVGYSVTACQAVACSTAGDALLWRDGQTVALGRFGAHQGIALAIDDAGRVLGGRQPGGAVLLEGGTVRELSAGGLATHFGAGGDVVIQTGQSALVWNQTVQARLSGGVLPEELTVHGIDRERRVAVTHRPFRSLREYPSLFEPDGSLFEVRWAVEDRSGPLPERITYMSLRGDIVGFGRDPASGSTRAMLLRLRS